MIFNFKSKNMYMKNYHKYLKYKNKYLKLKSNKVINQKGGNQKYLNFLNECLENGFHEEEVIEILFVYENKRPSYLKYFNIYPQPEEIFNNFKRIIEKHLSDKKWKFTREDLNDNQINKVNGFGRIFIHINDLTEKNQNDNHDNWVADNLGFFCKNFNPNTKENTISIQYYLNLNGKKSGLNSQTCNFFNEELEKKFEALRVEFNSVAEKINGNITFEKRTNYSTINLLKKWFTMDIDILDNNLMMQINAYYNDTIKHTFNPLDFERNIDYILKGDKIILFCLLLDIYNPFELLNMQPELEFNLEENPLNSYIRRFTEINLNEIDKNKLLFFLDSHNKLIYHFNFYSQRMNFLKKNSNLIKFSKKL